MMKKGACNSFVKPLQRLREGAADCRTQQAKHKHTRVCCYVRCHYQVHRCPLLVTLTKAHQDLHKLISQIAKEQFLIQISHACDF